MAVPSIAKAPAKRLARKRAFAVKTAERKFVRQIAAIKPTAESQQREQRLRATTRRAKEADFLDLFRLAA